MSGPLSEQVLEAYSESNFESDCVSYASAALLVYYAALNFPLDARRLWTRRSIATLISTINWLAITGTMITNIPLADNTTQRCASFGYVNAAVFIVNTAIFPLVAALRVHAVSGGNWRCVMLVWLLGMVPMGTNIWLLTQETWVVQPQLGCIDTVLTSDTIYNVAVIITRVSAVVSDILVVAATWYYIRHTSSVREQLVHDVWSARPNLTTVMFRDGTLCFLTISLLNLIDLVVNIISINTSSDIVNITNMISAMSSILVSHFLICVREAAERSIQAFSTQSLSFINSQGNSSPSSWLSSKEFASDIVNPSTEGSHANMFADLEDELDPSSEDEVREGSNDGIELEEFTASVHSVDARTS